MGKRRKHVYLILLAQTALLGVSWWVHMRYSAAVVHQAAQEEVWSDWEDGAAQLVSELGRLTLAAPAPDRADFQRVETLLEAGRPPQGEAMIVDRQWRVVVRGPDADRADAEGLRQGERASWTPHAASSSDATGPLRGMLATPNGAHLALAYALKDQQGYLLFHCPVADIEVTSGPLLRSLSGVGVMSFAWTCVLLGMGAYMLLARFYDGVDRKLARSAGETLRQTQNLIRTRDAVIFGLAKLADSRDPDTGDHLERISAYSTVLASALRRHPKFRNQVTPGFIRLIGISSALHDIGKVGIEDSILLQPGPLSVTQRARMQKHSTVGGKCLREIEQRLGSSNFLQMAREIALAHHERWDGTGYPNGLAGDAIPVSARIAAVADVYDALSSKRVYKDALPHEECVAIITGEAGKQFDPDMVKTWLTVESKYHCIARQYADPVPQAPEDVSGETVSEAKQGKEQECLVSSAAGG